MPELVYAAKNAGLINHFLFNLTGFVPHGEAAVELAVLPMALKAFLTAEIMDQV
jgi:hypothetical protein